MKKVIDSIDAAKSLVNKRKWIRFLGAAIIAVLGAFAFQNCSKGFSSSPNPNQSFASSDGHSYTWVESAWTACSQACGGGIQGRTVTCQRDGTDLADDAQCAGPLPASSQACNTQACTGPAVNGACGSSAGTVASTAPAANLCTTGSSTVPAAVGSTGAFRWTCAGSNNGTSASCSTRTANGAAVLPPTIAASQTINGSAIVNTPVAEFATAFVAAANKAGANPFAKTCLSQLTLNLNNPISLYSFADPGCFPSNFTNQVKLSANMTITGSLQVTGMLYITGNSTLTIGGDLELGTNLNEPALVYVDKGSTLITNSAAGAAMTQIPLPPTGFANGIVYGPGVAYFGPKVGQF